MAIAQEREARINGEITAREIRLIGNEGEQLGVVSLREAMALAEEHDVDLVEISPTAQPPVCKLMDYGKFKYEQSKKRHEAKQKQKQVQIKEVKFRPGTDEGDYQVKLKNLIRLILMQDASNRTIAIGDARPDKVFLTLTTYAHVKNGKSIFSLIMAQKLGDDNKVERVPDTFLDEIKRLVLSAKDMLDDDGDIIDAQ